MTPEDDNSEARINMIEMEEEILKESYYDTAEHDRKDFNNSICNGIRSSDHFPSSNSSGTKPFDDDLSCKSNTISRKFFDDRSCESKTVVNKSLDDNGGCTSHTATIEFSNDDGNG